MKTLKTRTIIWSLCAFVLSASLTLNSCSKDKDKDKDDPVLEVTGISLNKTTLSLTVGLSETLIPVITPDNAPDKTVSWISSKPGTATVDAGGLVTAVAPGSATITATAVGGNIHIDHQFEIFVRVCCSAVHISC